MILFSVKKIFGQVKLGFVVFSSLVPSCYHYEESKNWKYYWFWY